MFLENSNVPHVKPDALGTQIHLRASRPGHPPTYSTSSLCFRVAAPCRPTGRLTIQKPEIQKEFGLSFRRYIPLLQW